MHATVVLIYVLILVGIAVHKSRSVKSADDFMVAGRGVPVYMLVATLVCTWIGSGSLFGTAGLTFRTGFSVLWFSAGAWVGILVIYMIAARVRNIAQYTLTDLLEKRYSQAAKVLGTITIIIAYMVIAGYQFKGGGRFIAILSEGSITPEQGMLIACALIVGFTMLAGMVSIVSIDIFNGTVMLIAMIVTLPFAIASAAGPLRAAPLEQLGLELAVVVAIGAGAVVGEFTVALEDGEGGDDRGGLVEGLLDAVHEGLAGRGLRQGGTCPHEGSDDCESDDHVAECKRRS